MNTFLTEKLLMTASCVYLLILRSFSEQLFMERLRETVRLLISCKSCKISVSLTNKKLFHRYFPINLYKNNKQPLKSVHSIKIPENYLRRSYFMVKLQDDSLQVNAKSFSHILLHIFCHHFLRMVHNYFIRTSFENVRALVL